MLNVFDTPYTPTGAANRLCSILQRMRMSV